MGEVAGIIGIRRSLNEGLVIGQIENSIPILPSSQVTGTNSTSCDGYDGGTESAGHADNCTLLENLSAVPEEVVDHD